MEERSSRFPGDFPVLYFPAGKADHEAVEKRNCKIKSFGTLADEVRQNLREENEYADNTCKDLPGKGKTWLLHMFEISQQEDQHGETECSNRR